MTTRYHVSAKSLRGDVSAYAKRFSFVEVAVSGQGAPSLTTLKRWRKSAPPSFEFVPVAGRLLSSLERGNGYQKELDELRAALAVLESRMVLLRTPLSVTPTILTQKRLKHLHDALELMDEQKTILTQLAWEPDGPWEYEAAAYVAKQLGFVLVVDPTRDAIPPGAVVYLRLRALGERRSFGETALLRVLEGVGERRDAYVVFETEAALSESKQLRKLYSEMHVSTSSYRIIRPKAGDLRVRDDEQE